MLYGNANVYYMISFYPCLVDTGVVCLGSATKVLELSDRFLELRGDSKWLVMVSRFLIFFMVIIISSSSIFLLI